MKNKILRIFGIGAVILFVLMTFESASQVEATCVVEGLGAAGHITHEALTVHHGIKAFYAGLKLTLYQAWLAQGATECPHVFTVGIYLCTWNYDGSGGIWIIWTDTVSGKNGQYHYTAVIKL